jgi:uncharacterized lipoprotein YmbA
MMRYGLSLLAVGLLLMMAVCATAQEPQSVLTQPAPPPQQVQIQPTQAVVPVAQPTWLIRRGLFGWRAEPVVLEPVQVLVVKRPHVVWTPTVIWK